MSKVRTVLETGAVFGGFLRLCKHFLDNAEHGFQFNCLGFLACAMVLLLLHQLWPVLHEEVTRDSNYRMNYRKHSDQGLWCCLLLPSAYIVNIFKDDKQVLDIDVRFILMTVLLVLVQYNPSTVTQITSALLFLWLRTEVNKSEVPVYLICGLWLVFIYTSLSWLPQMFPHSFSEGETALVLQILALPLYTVSMMIYVGRTDFLAHLHSLPDGTKLCLIAFLGVTSAFILTWACASKQHPSRFYLAYGTAAITVVFPLIFFVFKGNPLHRIYLYLFKNTTRITLLSWWGVLALAAVMIVQLTNVSGRSNTRIRKFFHLIMCAVYVPGLLYDPDLLCTSSVIALGVMVILETMRMLKVPPLGDVLQSSFSIFLDKQDEGSLVLTPIYLLCGFSLPLWLSTSQGFQTSSLAPYAGVLSVGVGDTMASVCGSLMGRYKLPGTDKTIEGVICSVISQLVIIATVFTLTPDTVLAVILTALLEASTKQIDNLILPMFMYSLLMVS